MSAARRLLFGSGGDAGAALFTYGTSGLDADAPYTALARSSRVAIAGIGGEVAFYAVYVAIVVDQAMDLLLTAIIDDVRLAQQTLAVTPSAPGTRTRHVVEVPITVQLPNTVAGYATLGEWAPRGMWFQVELATSFDAEAGYVQIDGVEIEHDIIREGRASGENP